MMEGDLRKELRNFRYGRCCAYKLNLVHVSTLFEISMKEDDHHVMYVPAGHASDVAFLEVRTTMILSHRIRQAVDDRSDIFTGRMQIRITLFRGLVTQTSRTK